MVPELSLSTMWAIGQFKSLADFFATGQSLGFTRFELNHGVDSAMLQGLHLNGYRIPSVHEPCPADLSPATLKKRGWLISALDEDDRRRGVEATQRSIDLAHELGASVVIVHPGQVDLDESVQKRLLKLFRDGKSSSAEYAEVKARLVADRAAQAEANLEAVARSLGELADYAGQKDIRLGLENRYFYHEVPLPDELEYLLGLRNDDIIGYWHDVGHAQAHENLGLGVHEEWLKRFAPRIVGTHLHDIVGLDDHKAAGLGQIDWDMVARYLPADALRTCEFQPSNSLDQVAAGSQFLREKGVVRPARA